MYGWIWRRLPGPVGVRLVIAVVAIAAVVVVLFGWVFPLVDAAGWFDSGTVDS